MSTNRLTNEYINLRVHYRAGSPGDEAMNCPGGQPLAGFITQVWEGNRANLTIYDANGTPFTRNRVAVAFPEEQTATLLGGTCQLIELPSKLMLPAAAQEAEVSAHAGRAG